MNFANIGRHTIAAPLAALTLVAGGGIALAASGGAGPAPQAAEHRPVADPSPSPTVEPTDEPTDDPTDDPTDGPTEDASPTPSLTGLCKAARAGGYAASTKNGRVNPAWSALESAAGGASNVDSYCDATLAEDAAEKAARKGTDVDDDDLDKGKPAKGPKPDKVKGGDNDDADNDDADNDDAGEADSDDDGDGGSRASEHRKN